MHVQLSVCAIACVCECALCHFSVFELYPLESENKGQVAARIIPGSIFQVNERCCQNVLFELSSAGTQILLERI